MTFTSFLAHLAGQLNSSVFVLLFILAAFVWMVYKAGQIVATWNNRDSEIAKLRADWNRDIPPLKARVDLVFQAVYPGTAIKTNSPVHLTDVGREISQMLDADSVAKRHIDKLRKLVDQSAPQTAYDLQKACFAVVEQHLPALLDDAQLRIAKDQSLKHGIPLDNALAVVGIALRDRLLLEKGWLPDDVDKHAPAE